MTTATASPTKATSSLARTSGVISGGSCAVRNWSGSRSCASSGARSASVNTARTPGYCCAALTSMARSSAWACGLRTNAASSMSAKRRSATKRPPPVSRGRSSSRLMEWPTKRVAVTAYTRRSPWHRAGEELWAKRHDTHFDFVSGLQPLFETPLHPRIVVGPPLVIHDMRDLLIVGVGGQQLRQGGVEQIEGLGVLRRVVEQARKHRLVFGAADEIEGLHPALRVG